MQDDRGRTRLQSADGSDVTRYLCAAAYLDSRFAWDVVEEVVLDQNRAVAPSPGTDVATVARHSLAALRRATRRDVLLTLIVVTVALLAGLQGVLIAAWLFSWALVARAIRSLARGELGSAFSQLGGFLLISMCFLLVLLLRSDQPLLSTGGRSVRVPLESTQVLGLVVAGLWIVNYLDRVASYGVLAEQLSRFRFSPAAAPPESERWRERLAYVSAAAGSRLSGCSQDAPNAPFAGFGTVVHTWSVSCRLEPGPASNAGSGAGSAGADAYRGARPGPSLSLAELYAGLMTRGATAGFTVGEIVLASGWLPPGHPFLDQARQRPVPGIPPVIVYDIATRPGGAESYHLFWSSSAPSTAPDAGLVAHGFVQASVRDDQLALDVALTVLPPVDARYRAADRFGHASVLTMAGLLGAALLDVGRRTPQAPVNLVRSGLRLWSRRGENAGDAGRFAGPAGRDFGARAGVRELASRRAGSAALAGDYEATRQVNLLSRELTAAMSGLLVQRGFDPAPFMRAADPVWQKPLKSGPGRGALVP